MTTSLRMAALAICGALAAPASAQDLDAGLEAARAGDYQTALENWLPLAEQGDAKAQRNLGSMYRNGRGETQDDAKAERWFRKAVEQFRLAAEQGDADAQYSLGFMYRNGQGVMQNAIEGERWLRKAAA